MDKSVMIIHFEYFANKIAFKSSQSEIFSDLFVISTVDGQSVGPATDVTVVKLVLK